MRVHVVEIEHLVAEGYWEGFTGVVRTTVGRTDQLTKASVSEAEAVGIGQAWAVKHLPKARSGPKVRVVVP